MIMNPNAPTISQAEIENSFHTALSLDGITCEGLVFSNQTFPSPIAFTDSTFTGSVRFDNCIFKGGVVFERCEFQQAAHFRFCRFQQPAAFTASRFRESADFTGSRFSLAYFWRTFFDAQVSFLQIEVKPDERQNDTFLYPGESNFSFARFLTDADFTRAGFYGPVYFIGTLFGYGTFFNEVTFDHRVRFENWKNQFCMSRTDIIDIVDGKWRGAEEYRASDMDVKRDLICDPARGLFTRLLIRGVIRKSGDHLGNVHQPLFNMRIFQGSYLLSK
ncbi:MAG: pentapeptide repeat-containing protein [bacterium]